MRLILGVLVLIALAAPQPAVSRGAIEHGKLRAPWIAILPDAERKLVVMVNRVRRNRGLPPLIVDASLRTAARAHSRDMALRRYVGHGSSRTLRGRLAGFVRRGARFSENVALARTIEDAHVALVASPAHLRNMLDPTFHRVGIGVAIAEDLGIMITEDFT